MKKRFLFLFLISGLVLMNACQREYSLESGNTPSEGTLQDDGTGDCLPKTVAGAYVVGTALVGTTNYIEVQANVTKLGSYTIYTDTVNGMYFRGTGVFTVLGLNTVQLKGNGTPTATGISNFIVTYGLSGCTIAVTTVGSLAVFTLNGSPNACMNAAVAGTYTAGVALNASNNVTINVNVTTVGAYNVSTLLSNNMTFSGSGVFTVPGAQAIVLTGSGTPGISQTTSIPVTTGSSSCNFQVTVGAAASAATFTINCATTPTINGTYTVGTALGATNTVGITVDVATPGTYTITGTINGMTFSNSGTFASAGAGQAVTLTSTGNPTTAGANTVLLTGGTASCNITVNVNPAAGGAVFTVNCAAALINGTYTVGTALVATNTVGITVDVTTPGTYTITGTINGMTFSKSGTFAAAGAGQAVTLTSTGTPTTAGANIVSLTGGTGSCNITVNVNPGPAVFTVNCASPTANGTYTQGIALTASNTVTLSVNVTTAGTYNITTTAVNGMTFNSGAGTWAAGAQTLTLTGSGTPAAAGTFFIPVTAGTTPCNFLLIVATTSTDYFPRTTNSNWSYEFDDVSTDSLYRKVIAPTLTASGNTYNIFMRAVSTGFDSSGYYRKNGGDYFEYLDVGGFIGYDNAAFAEYTMLKDNVPATTNWKSAGFSGTVTGTPLTLRFSYTILQKDVPITVVSSSTGSITYQNVIVVEEKYEQFTGGNWVDVTSLIDFYGKSYYARGVGLIKYEPLNAAGVVQPGKQELRRYVVY